MAFTKVVGAGIHTLSNITSHNIHSSGIVTATGLDISGDATIGGVLTYEDVKNIDSVGLITARNGIDCNGDLDVDGHTNLDNVSIAGVVTATTGVRISANGDLRFANGTWSGEVAGKIQHSSNKLYIQSGSSGTQIRRADGQSSWEWQTNGHFLPGLDNNVNIGSDAKRVLNIYTDNLDVDSHTNLDNISVAGVTTFSDDVKFDGATAGRDIIFDRSDNRLKFANSTKASFGNSNQMEVYHSGSFAYITNVGGRIDVSGDVKLNNDLDIVGDLVVDSDLDVDGLTNLDDVIITGFTTFATGTKFFNHTPRIEMQGNNTAILSFVNATTGTTTSDGMLMGFSSSSKAGFINVNESAHGFVLKVGGSHTSAERINISGVGTVSIRKGTTEEMITARPNSSVELYYDGNKRLETSSVGVSIPQDLDVDGHTNLDNVSIAGVTTFTSNAQYPITINGNDDGKIILQGSSNPYIRFQENTTDKAYIQWHSSGFIRLVNSEDNSQLRIQDNLRFSTDGSNFYSIWHAGNDGSGSGLDSDTLDGIQGTSFLRSDANDTSSGNIAFGNVSLDPDSFSSFSGGFGNINDGSGWGARGVFVHGGGTGDAAAMAHNGSKLYFGIQNGSSANSMETWLDVTPGSRIINFQTDDNANNVRIGGNKIFHAGNDGSGSGLDADTLDGVQGSSFLRSDANDTASGNLTFNGVVSATNDGDTPDKIGDFKIGRNINSISSIDNLDSFLLSKKDGSFTSGTKPSGTNNAFGVLSLQTHSGNYFSQLGFYSSANQLWIRSTNNSTIYSNWQRVWSENNDGAGSGLDADTLDGVQGSSFLRSDADDTATGQITLSGGVSTNGKDVYISNGAVISNDADGAFAARSGGNIDHIWHSDSSADGMGGTWHFCSDTTYKANGNARVYAGFFSRAGNKVWDEGNDGAGSGLDSDKLDGEEGSYYRNASNLNAGTIPAARIGNKAITFEKMQDIPEERLIGRVSSGSGRPEHLTQAQVRTFLGLASSATTDTTNASNISSGTLNTARLPNTYTKAGQVVVQATGAGNDVKLDAADHIILEAGEEEDGNIYFRGNGGADQYRFAKSGQHTIEGFLSFQSLTADRTFTFPNTTGTLALTSSNITGTSGGFTAGNASNLNSGTIPDARIPDTITPATLVSTIELRTSNGQQLVLNAGESAGKVSGQNAEYVYVNAEGGLSVNTPDSANVNWQGGTAVDTTIIKGTEITINNNRVWDAGGSGNEAHSILLNGATNFDNLKKSGFYSLYNVNNSGHTNAPFRYGAMISANNSYSGLGMGMQIAHERTGGGTFIRGMNDTNDNWYPWEEIWTSGTDGPGSGLDADTLDGIQGSNFLRSDTSDTMSLGAGALTLDKGGNANQALDVSSTATNGATRIRFLENGTSKGELAYSHDNDQLELVARSGQKITMYTNATGPYFTLSTSGYMNVPSQPGIYLDGLDWSSGNRYMHSGYQFWQNGNNWDNNSGTFTCPIAGKYLVAADAQGHNTHTQTGASDTYANLIPHRNNLGYGLESVATTKGDNGGTHIHTVFGFSIIMDCGVNDTIRVYSNHGFRTNTQNHLAIWLLG